MFGHYVKYCPKETIDKVLERKFGQNFFALWKDLVTLMRESSFHKAKTLREDARNARIVDVTA